MAKPKPKTKKASPSKPAKKTSAKPAPSKRKPAPAHAKKPAPVKPAAPAKKPEPARKPAPAAKATPVSMAKSDSKNALRANILKRKATAKPIAFSLDEVRAIAKTVTTKTAAAKPVKQPGKAAAAIAPVKPAKPNHIKAASLADILGFNPKKQAKLDPTDDANVPEKYKRFYRLLLDLRHHLTAGIELHSEETLKRSAKDDAGDLSSYGQHMADAGTDTFDRDFALSLVSSEQEALSEIDAAIKRIHAGTYGVCEHTQQPIPKERLLAVPFTRYTADAQKEIERNRHRSRTQAGLFGEHGEDSGKMMEDSGDE